MRYGLSMPSRYLAVFVLLGGCCLAQQPLPLAVEEAVAPAYPRRAVTARISGSVIVEVRVCEHGAVTAATIEEGNALLRQATLEAARLWRFQPQPGSHDVKLIFSFRLMPKDTPEAQLGTVFRPPYTVEVRKITPEPVSRFARYGVGRRGGSELSGRLEASGRGGDPGLREYPGFS